MIVEAELFDAIADEPDDDERRLVFADAVARSQPERAELIALQCGIARGTLARADAVVARKRAAELLAEHGARWSGLDGVLSHYEFERGFVERVRIEAGALIARGDELLARTPALRRIDVVGLVADLHDQVAPATSRVGELVRTTAERALATLAVRETPHLGLSRVGVVHHSRLFNNFHDMLPATLAHMRTTGVLDRLRGLALPMIDGALLDRIVSDERAAHLELLELTSGALAFPFEGMTRTPVAPYHLRLGASRIPYRDLGGLARNAIDLGPISGVLELTAMQREQLRTLAVAWNQKTARRELSTDRAFAGITDLTVIDDHLLDAESLAPLLHASHLRPRVLRLRAPVDRDTVRIIAASPLASVVEVLDLRGRTGARAGDLDTSSFDGVAMT
jgi:uncharacterized protein (TIGR02996 family)|nr:TIGR02996 domain-containing protein [Kofleriaceae bacterium]